MSGRKADKLVLTVIAKKAVVVCAVSVMIFAAAAASSPKSDEETGRRVRGVLEFLRELDYTEDVGVETRGTREMRRFIPEIEKAYRQTPDKVALYERVWKLLRLVPEDMDLAAELKKLHSKQARSFYDADSETVFLDSESRSKVWNSPLIQRVMEQIEISESEFILSRDMAYALLHQNFGGLSIQDAYWSLDQFMAWRATVDGGATTMVMDYVVHDSGVSVLLLPNPGAIVSYFIPLVTNIDRETLDSTPRFIRSWFAFPFAKGTPFIFHQRKSGRHYLVDSAYRNHPLSTEQIIHPEKFYEVPDNPIEIIMPDLAGEVGEESRLIYKDTWGEWGLNQLLVEWLDRKETASVVSGWGGDRIAVYEAPGGRLTAAWFTTWDSAKDARLFESALANASRQSALKEKIRIGARRIGRDVAFVVTGGEEIPDALMDRLWQSAKSPVVIPPPVPEKPSPESLEIDIHNFMGMLLTKSELHTGRDDTWKVEGDTFRNERYRYQVTRPNSNWYFHRVKVGSMFLSEFTALNTKEMGANFSLMSFRKYGDDVPNPVEEIVSIMSDQMINFKKVDEKQLTVGGYPARTATYTAFAIVHLRVTYTEIFADEHNYIITFWAAKPTYDKLEPEFKAFRDSFRVLE